LARDQWLQVATGKAYSLVRKVDGSLWAFGDNSAGQLGDLTTYARALPVQVKTLSNYVAGMAAGSSHSLVRMVDGTLWAMGSNRYGQLGHGTATRSNAVPQLVMPIRSAGSVVEVAAGAEHSLVRMKGGVLYAMGSNSEGQLGVHVQGERQIDSPTPFNSQRTQRTQHTQHTES
jgi:alpha-tubulin suppressor-like RCC1 family protein